MEYGWQEGQAASEGKSIDLQNRGNLKVIEKEAEEVHPQKCRTCEILPSSHNNILKPLGGTPTINQPQQHQSVYLQHTGTVFSK